MSGPSSKVAGDSTCSRPYPAGFSRCESCCEALTVGAWALLCAFDLTSGATWLAAAEDEDATTSRAVGLLCVGASLLPLLADLAFRKIAGDKPKKKSGGLPPVVRAAAVYGMAFAGASVYLALHAAAGREAHAWVGAATLYCIGSLTTAHLMVIRYGACNAAIVAAQPAWSETKLPVGAAQAPTQREPLASRMSHRVSLLSNLSTSNGRWKPLFADPTFGGSVILDRPQKKPPPPGPNGKILHSSCHANAAPWQTTKEESPKAVPSQQLPICDQTPVLLPSFGIEPAVSPASSGSMRDIVSGIERVDISFADRPTAAPEVLDREASPSASAAVGGLSGVSIVRATASESNGAAAADPPPPQEAQVGEPRRASGASGASGESAGGFSDISGAELPPPVDLPAPEPPEQAPPDAARGTADAADVPLRPRPSDGSAASGFSDVSHHAS